MGFVGPVTTGAEGRLGMPPTRWDCGCCVGGGREPGEASLGEDLCLLDLCFFSVFSNGSERRIRKISFVLLQRT